MVALSGETLVLGHSRADEDEGEAGIVSFWAMRVKPYPHSCSHGYSHACMSDE